MCQLGCLHVSTNNIDNESNIKVNVPKIKKWYVVASTRAMSITHQKMVPSCIGTYITRATIKHLGVMKNVKTKIYMI
jgi:intein-encoded DNA endonuclease-like protein